MAAMLAVIPSALGSFTSGPVLSLQQSIRKNQACSSPRRSMCSSSGRNSVDALRLFQFNPIQSGCLLSDRRSFQQFLGHEHSQRCTLRSSRSRICKPDLRMGSSSHAGEIIDKLEGEIRTPGGNSVRSWNALTRLALLGSGGSITLSTGAAWAEEVVVDTSAQATEGAADTVLGFLFTAALIGLSILTIGVIYLSVADWLEKRERDALAKAAGPEQDKLGAPVEKKLERFAPRGFGKKVEKAEKDKKVEQKS